MIKNTLLALVAVASVSSIALPAFAVDGPFGSGISESRDWAASNILNRLQEQGINATGVEEWGQLVRAYVVLDDGTRVMQLFTADTLTPVSL